MFICGTFWGHSSKQYLCTPDGTIIATNDSEEKADNILDIYQNSGGMTKAEKDKLASLMKEKDGNFQYTHDGKTELGSICDVDNGKFLLVETFPPEVLSELTAPTLR